MAISRARNRTGNGGRRAVVLSLVVVLSSLFVPFAYGADDDGAQDDCTESSTGSIPITDLGEATYQGVQGGLYPGGLNTPTPEHEAAGLMHSAAIEPLDGEGNPDLDGLIAVVAIGVPDTFREFQDFATIVEGKTAPAVVLVNAAEAGEAIRKWADANSEVWSRVDTVIDAAGATDEQVQAAWINIPERIDSRTELELFPASVETYQHQLADVLRIAKNRYPNLQIAYVSSRMYGGYNTTLSQSPEPMTYESGFGVKWLIEDQITGTAGLNHSVESNLAEVPWIAWGPYLWADGTTARSDGLTWDCSDFRHDGTHSTESGVRKVAVLLAEHFLSSPTAVPWFTSTGEQVELGELPPPARRQDTTRDTTDDSRGDRPDREDDTRSRTSTTTASLTSTPDGSSVTDDTQGVASSEAQRGRNDASVVLIVAVAVLTIVVALGIVALVRSRRSEDG